jgi:hypothetical protein
MCMNECSHPNDEKLHKRRVFTRAPRAAEPDKDVACDGSLFLLTRCSRGSTLPRPLPAPPYR